MIDVPPASRDADLLKSFAALALVRGSMWTAQIPAQSAG